MVWYRGFIKTLTFLGKARTFIECRGTILGMTSTDVTLGLLSVLLGDVEQASEHFENAIQFCESAGYPTEQAWAQFHYAEELRNAGRDQAKVDELLDDALAIANEFGMKLLTRRALAQREILKA